MSWSTTILLIFTPKSTQLIKNNYIVYGVEGYRTGHMRTINCCKLKICFMMFIKSLADKSLEPHIIFTSGSCDLD